MSFTNDWQVTDNPPDHSKFKQVPSFIRKLRTDLEERLKNILSGFISGETEEGVKKLPLQAQSSDPSAETDKNIPYAKKVGEITELFVRDSAGNIVQITSGGKFHLNTMGSGTPSSSTFLRGDGTWSNILETIYPVGSLYISTLSTNPATLLGFGTWEAFGKGKVLVGLDPDDADFDTVEETGGAKTINIPAHTHNQNMGAPISVNLGNPWCNAASSFNADMYSSGDTPGYYRVRTGVQSGGGSTQSVVQPYIVVYMWKRTA